MDEGILLLRVLLGLVLLVHAVQKSLGWFQGLGLTVMAGAFESLGLRPGRPMVLMASITEALAAVSLLLGRLTPLGAAAAFLLAAVAALLFLWLVLRRSPAARPG
ncbi:DoxX family membrane protein [Kocuria sp. CPCC 205292]|uniref:DoxX family membrane protein n=1 Tax=Kocuria cellulosilytica TaxID=3071451 RepID=UPI0034D4CB1D